MELEIRYASRDKSVYVSNYHLAMHHSCCTLKEFNNVFLWMRISHYSSLTNRCGDIRFQEVVEVTPIVRQLNAGRKECPNKFPVDRHNFVG